MAMVAACGEQDDTYIPPDHRILISGKATLSNSTGIANVLVDMTGTEVANALTNSSGYFSFAGLLEGRYKLELSHDDYDFDPAQTLIITNSDVVDANFVGTPK